MWALLLAGCGADVVPPAGGPSARPHPEAPHAEEAVVIDRIEVLAEGPGWRLERAAWTAGAERGWDYRVKLPREAPLDVVPSATVRPLEELLPPGPQVAINGGFYDTGPMGLVTSDGVVLQPLSARGGSGVLLAAPGPPRIVHRDDAPRSGDPAAPVEALQSIDRLVADGRSVVGARAEARPGARSAIVLAADATWFVASVSAASVREEGPTGASLQQTVARGLTLGQLATHLVATLGAREVLNLDGAVSTQLVVRWAEGAWTLRGERGTINAVRWVPPEG